MEIGKIGKWNGIPADVIKLVAMVAMLLDHIGAVFQEYLNEEVYMVLRALGRLAFPIFAFFIVEGYFHTRSEKKYLLRLLAFALISELPFDYAFFSYWQESGLLYWKNQNVFITLALGLALIWSLETVKIKFPAVDSLSRFFQFLSRILIVFAGLLMADVLGSDYGHMGILLILLFYVARGYQVPHRVPQVVALIVWLLFYDFQAGRVVESYGVVAALFILLYNGERGTLPLPKWVFYAFYPVHILILIGIREAM